MRGGLSPRDVRALRAIAGSPLAWIGLDPLAHKLSVDRDEVCDHLAVLEDLGYVVTWELPASWDLDGTLYHARDQLLVCLTDSGSRAINHQLIEVGPLELPRWVAGSRSHSWAARQPPNPCECGRPPRGSIFDVLGTRVRETRRGARHAEQDPQLPAA